MSAEQGADVQTFLIYVGALCGSVGGIVVSSLTTWWWACLLPLLYVVMVCRQVRALRGSDDCGAS
jgi:hypothetical protein